MTIVSCPRCSDEVALPAGASPKATVRCPLCQDEFLLSDILDSMPPLLIVVDDPEAFEAAGVAVPDFRSGAAGVDAGELALAGPDPVPVTPSFGIESSVAPATGAVPTSRRRRAAPRPRKKRSAAMETVKIVLGGIAGLAIAQLILWWNPWKRTDPFRLAPKVGDAAPWIVPAELRGEKKKAGGDETTDQNGSAKPGTAPSEVGELPTRTFVDPNKVGAAGGSKEVRNPPRKAKRSQGGGMMGVPDTDATANVFKTEPASVPDDPPDPAEFELEPTDPGDDLVGNLSIDSDPEKMLDSFASPAPEDPVAGTTESADAAEATPPRFANAPRLTGAEVNEAFKDAQTIVRAWNATEDADSKDLLRQTYLALAGLGEAITFAEQGSQLDEAEVTDVLKSLTDDDTKLTKLGEAGEMWIGSKRGRVGVLLLGTVKGIERQGDLYETKLAVSADANPTSLYTDGDPRDAYQVDSKALVLGAVIEDPASNLSGYEGEAESVIWSQLSIVVAK